MYDLKRTLFIFIENIQKSLSRGDVDDSKAVKLAAALCCQGNHGSLAVPDLST